MRNPKESLRESLIDSIASCGLSAEQAQLAERYLDGETDSCDLQIASRQNILDQNHVEIYGKVKKCYERLVRHKEDDLIRRYFEVTFQIFGTSLNRITNWNDYVKNLLPKAKRIALQVDEAAGGRWFGPYFYKQILKTSKDREVLKEALAYIDKNTRYGELYLLTAMFYEGSAEKPWNKVGLASLENEKKDSRPENVLGKLSRLIAGSGKTETDGFETNEYVKKYPEEFERYAKKYSEVITSIFIKPFTRSQQEELQDYICNRAVRESVPAELTVLTAGTPFDEETAKYFIGMASTVYRLSPTIYGFLKVCLAGHMEQTFENMLEAEGKGNMNREILHWYADFAPDEVRFIKWLGMHDKERRRSCGGLIVTSYDSGHVLATLAKKNPQAYIEAMKSTDAGVYETLAEALREGVDKAFYQKYFSSVLDDGKASLRQSVIRRLAEDMDPALAADVEKFLSGQEKIGILYPQEKALSLDGQYKNISEAVVSYRSVYGEDEFYERCAALLGLRRGNYTLSACCRTTNHNFSADLAKTFLEKMKSGGLDCAHRLQAACVIYDGLWSGRDECGSRLQKLFEAELTGNRAETVKAFREASVIGRIWGIQIMGQKPEQYKEELFAYFTENSKQVKEEFVTLLTAHEEWAQDVLATLKNSKKATERELAASVIGKYKNVKEYSEALKEALEKEKSRKVADVIKEALKAGGAIEDSGECACENADADTNVSAESYVKECHKGGKKRVLAWLYAEPMPQVHFAGQNESEEKTENPQQEGQTDCEPQEVQAAEEEYMQAVLLSYASMPVPGVNSEVHILTDILNRQELADFMEVLFERWMAAGAEAKKKWVLYAAAIHGGAKLVPRLQHQINEWAAASRGAIAAEAVKALSLNDSPTALLIVDGIARKYKFKQVRKAAQDALQFAAEQLNLTVEELADRIVPDLGFDERMERHFDYGSRSFTVRISPSLEIEVTNDAGKKIKTLPAVGRQDDEAKATAALAEFKELKKQMKTTVKNQTLRLELALSLDRRWTVENWQKLFVQNPIMHQFAISLIWGYYEDGECKQTFRYMEDGTFNTADEEEYELSGNGTVGLLHPVEMEKKEIDVWLEQLSDYEITQSVQQLDRPVYRVTEEEVGRKHLERFGGMILNGLSLSGKLTGLGWSKGTPQDAGIYSEFYRKDADADYGVELRFSGTYIADENEEVTVYDASFYRLSDYDKRGFRYDLKKDEKALKLDEVPPRYFSEIINQLTKATASSTEINEAWKEEI